MRLVTGEQVHFSSVWMILSISSTCPVYCTLCINDQHVQCHLESFHRNILPPKSRRFLLLTSHLKLSIVTIIVIIGPILDRLKETFLKPWKGVLCIHFRVCVSVCLRRLQCTPFDVGIQFLGWVILGTWERNAFFDIFFFFWNFHFYAFYWHFSIFFLI